MLLVFWVKIWLVFLVKKLMRLFVLFVILVRKVCYRFGFLVLVMLF